MELGISSGQNCDTTPFTLLRGSRFGAIILFVGVFACQQGSVSKYQVISFVLKYYICRGLIVLNQSYANTWCLDTKSEAELFKRAEC